MCRPPHRVWKLLTTTVAAALIFFLPCAAAESDFTQYLIDHYKDKTLILRGFYGGDHLEYDATGGVVKADSPGDWTVAGVVRVKDFRVLGQRLNIRALRLHFGWSGNGMQEMHDYNWRGKLIKDEKENRTLLIEADLGLATGAAADRILSQIFLTSQDNFADLVPDYWKPCVAAATGKGKRVSQCHFSAEFFAIPGVVPLSGQGTISASGSEPEEATNGDSQPPRDQRYRLGSGIRPPNPLNRPNPEFTDEARRAKFGGTSLVSLVVDKLGEVKNVRILKPLGMGLDQRAVETAMKYRFEPAMKDGQPVAVEIALEVDFHLY